MTSTTFVLLAVGVLVGSAFNPSTPLGGLMSRRFIPARVRAFYCRRRHKRLALIATGLVPLLTAGAALAFILVVFSGSASKTSTLPSQASSQDLSSAMSVSFDASNLHVGGSTPYAVTVDTSSLSGEGHINGVSVTPASSNQSACFPVWFAPTNPTSYPIDLKPNTGMQTIASGMVQFNSDPANDQSGCGGVQITLNAQITP